MKGFCNKSDNEEVGQTSAVRVKKRVERLFWGKIRPTARIPGQQVGLAEQ